MSVAKDSKITSVDSKDSKIDLRYLKDTKNRLIKYINHLLFAINKGPLETPITRLRLLPGFYEETGIEIIKQDVNVGEELTKSTKLLEAITIIENQGQDISNIALALKHLVHLKDRDEVEQFANGVAKTDCPK